MLPPFQATKENSVAFSINKMLQDFVVMVDGSKKSDAVGMSIRCCFVDDIVLGPNLDVLSSITHGGWNFRGENRILLYLNFFNHCLYSGRALQGSHDVTTMIYPPNISAFFEENNRQIVTNFIILMFNTKMKALNHD